MRKRHYNCPRESQHSEACYRSGGFYRSRGGVLFGVCGGVAERLDISTFWTRAAVLAAFIFTGFWPVGAAYLVAALLMKPAPVVPFESVDDAEFYNSYAGSRSMAVGRIKRTYDSLDRRIQRMESIVTGKNYDWDRRMNES